MTVFHGPAFCGNMFLAAAEIDRLVNKQKQIDAFLDLLQTIEIAPRKIKGSREYLLALKKCLEQALKNGKAEEKFQEGSDINILSIEVQ